MQEKNREKDFLGIIYILITIVILLCACLLVYPNYTYNKGKEVVKEWYEEVYIPERCFCVEPFVEESEFYINQNIK